MTDNHLVGRTFLTGVVGLAFVAGLTAQNASPPRTTAMQALTVPAARLPEGCGLQAIPANAGAWTPGGPVPSTSHPAGITANPWLGTDKRRLSELRQVVERHLVRVPDALPITREQRSAFALGWADGVAEGYVATYSEFGNTIQVQAIRFDAAPDLLFPPRVVQFEIGLIRAALSGPVGPCRKAIETYLKTL